jgi:N-acetylated-alpha-linked acidic dipeptidase
MRQERALTQPEGLAGRPWFKHMIYAPGRLTGYAAQFLPALEDAIKAGDAATANRYRDLVLDSLERATALASRPR